MKWIPKIVTTVFVLMLVTQKVVSPHQSLFAEVVIDVLIVACLLGLGEQFIGYVCLHITRAFTQSISNGTKAGDERLNGIKDSILKSTTQNHY